MDVKQIAAWMLCIALAVLSGCAVQQPVMQEESEPSVVQEGTEVSDEPDKRAAEIGQTEVIHGEEYVLTFLDEFEGDKLNRDNWVNCPAWERADRGGRWWPACVTVENGKLALQVESHVSGRYLSGGVRTFGTFSQAYGYYEISMRVQDVPGFWSAFWMMCGDVHNEDGSAKDGVEIDIMEAYDVKTRSINHALHWDGYEKAHQRLEHKEHQTDVYDGQFHTYALRWAPDSYTWYIDGEPTWVLETDDVCTQPGYMKISTEVGSWAGEINPEDLPASIEVDYVRAYQFAEMEPGK